MDKLAMLKQLTDETDEDILLTFLSIAESKILERLYPYDWSKETVPKRYEHKQIEIAVYLYNKQGAEGQVAHSENSINRVYENADVPESLMRGITPYVGVVK